MQCRTETNGGSLKMLNGTWGYINHEEYLD
jgi:hypothetical protein